MALACEGDHRATRDPGENRVLQRGRDELVTDDHEDVHRAGLLDPLVRLGIEPQNRVATGLLGTPGRQVLVSVVRGRLGVAQPPSGGSAELSLGEQHQRFVRKLATRRGEDRR